MKSPSNSPAPRWWLPTLAGLALAACSPDEPQVKDNAFPGQISAGGATSGEIIASAKSPDTKPGPEEPEGTPGIPQGSGGTTGGPDMGGTTKDESGGAAPDEGTRRGDAAQRGAEQSESGGKQAKAAAADEDVKAKAKADMQKRQLEAAMDRLAARYEARQASPGATGQSEPPEADAAQSPAQAGPLGDRVGASQEPPRSEKHGTAPPSEDVKQPQPQSPEETDAALPSDTYKSED
jgi:hypothetical protein